MIFLEMGPPPPLSSPSSRGKELSLSPFIQPHRIPQQPQRMRLTSIQRGSTGAELEEERKVGMRYERERHLLLLLRG